MKKGSSASVLFWIILALVIFAIGYIGTSLVQQQERQRIQDGPAPILPVDSTP